MWLDYVNKDLERLRTINHACELEQLFIVYEDNSDEVACVFPKPLTREILEIMAVLSSPHTWLTPVDIHGIGDDELYTMIVKRVINE